MKNSGHFLVLKRKSKLVLSKSKLVIKKKKKGCWIRDRQKRKKRM